MHAYVWKFISVWLSIRQNDANDNPASPSSSSCAEFLCFARTHSCPEGSSSIWFTVTSARLAGFSSLIRLSPHSSAHFHISPSALVCVCSSCHLFGMWCFVPSSQGRASSLLWGISRDTAAWLNITFLQINTHIIFIPRVTNSIDQRLWMASLNCQLSYAAQILFWNIIMSVSVPL